MQCIRNAELMVMFIVQALLYYDPMGGENMPALSALLNYIGTYLRHFFAKMSLRC